MKLITWNVNSVNTLTSWHPYSDKTLYPDFNSILLSLDADVICLQEVKSTQSNMAQEFHTLKDFHAFYSLHPKGGYSGVGTFVKKHLCPTECEQGFSGQSVYNQHSDTLSSIGGCKELMEEFGGKQELLRLDGEGRCLIISFGDFIIFNVYFPAATETKERQEFKRKFSEALRFRADFLIKQGYKVIVAGDMNATRSSLDRYDVKSDDDLATHPPSMWINGWIESGTVIDSFRYLYPFKKDSYTVWNMKEIKRPVNQGSRIDYFLLSQNLVPFLKDCLILKDVQGSDHCPVFLVLEDSIPNGDDESSPPCLLFPISGITKPPTGCTCYWQSFGDKQKKLVFQSREGGSFDANVPSLSQRFGSSTKSNTSAVKVSKVKKNTKGSIAAQKPNSKQSTLHSFVKANQK